MDWGIGFAEPLAAAGILTTGNKMPLRSHLIFVCSVSSSNQFGWIPPYKNKMVLSDHLIFCCGRRGLKMPNLEYWKSDIYIFVDILVFTMCLLFIGLFPSPSSWKPLFNDVEQAVDVLVINLTLSSHLIYQLRDGHIAVDVVGIVTYGYVVAGI